MLFGEVCEEELLLSWGQRVCGCVEDGRGRVEGG